MSGANFNLDGGVLTVNLSLLTRDDDQIGNDTVLAKSAWRDCKSILPYEAHGIENADSLLEAICRAEGAAQKVRRDSGLMHNALMDR